jgi:teichuronic acid exporter
MVDSLRVKTLRGLSWSFLESMGVRGVQFVIGIMLARLLSPTDFGLIGMVLIFTELAQSLMDSGFQAALIQKQEATRADTSSIFYFNIVIGLAAASLLCIVAPWIAAFYDQPILTPVTRALSLVIIINSFGLIQYTFLMKEIEFKTLAKVSFATGMLSGMLGISLAVAGFGVWSLVAQQLSSAFLLTFFMWVVSDWRPVPIFSLKSLREMFGFGSRILASGLINKTFENIYLVIIGKLFSAVDLGFFTRAKVMQELPSATLSWIIGRVTFPIFSSIHDDPVRLKRGMRKALSFLILVNFPMMIGLAVIARPVVVVLLTERWVECVPYLQLLCLAGLLSPVMLINSNLLFASGQSKIHLRVEIIKKVFIILNIALTWRWGISAMIYGMIVTSITSLFLNSYYTGVLIGYSIRAQLHDLFPSLIIALLMGMGVYASGLVSFPSYWVMLLVQIAIGSTMYICLCRLFRIAAFMEIWEMGRERWTKMLMSRAETVR